MFSPERAIYTSNNPISNYIYFSYPFKISFATLHFIISNLIFFISNFLNTLLNIQCLFQPYQHLSNPPAFFSTHTSIISIYVNIISAIIYAFPALPIPFLNILAIFQPICTMFLRFALHFNAYQGYIHSSPHHFP